MDRKIALFLPSLAGGGAERVMLNLTRGFVEAGFKVDLVVASFKGAYTDNVPMGVCVVGLKSRSVIRSLPNLISYLHREKPYAILSALDHANVVVICARRIASVKTKVFVTLHTTISRSSVDKKAIKDKILLFLIRKLYKKSNGIIAVSKGVADDFSSFMKIKRDEISVIYNPVLTPQMFLSAKEEVDHPWFVRGQPPVVIAIGRLTQAKGFSNLINAFSEVRKAVDCNLVILGEGEERENLEQLKNELGLQDHVWMPGFVSNPYKYISKSTLFVLSSLWEGLPTVLIESIALKVPVVATNCKSGPSEILEILNSGVLVEPDSAAELSTAITKSLQASARFYEAENLDVFTLEKSISEYIKIIK